MFTSLPYGIVPKIGRFLSSIGYLNEQHQHVWDFYDARSPYQAFLGGQFTQRRPAGQVGRADRDLHRVRRARSVTARASPAPTATGTASAAARVYVHAGGDIGASNSGAPGCRICDARPDDRNTRRPNVVGNAVLRRLLGQEPAGDRRLRLEIGAERQCDARTSFKLQGEYFWRRETRRPHLRRDGALGLT